MDTQHNLIDLFNKYFEVVLADTEEKRRECFRLRYEVYRNEGILPGSEEDFSNSLESDEYDEHSVNFLLIHKAQNRIIGTVRTILADPNKPDKKLPIEKVAGDAPISEFLSYQDIPRSRLGEVSRLIIAPEFRVRKGESQRPYGVSDDYENSPQRKERRRQPNDSWQGPEHRNDTPRRLFPHTAIGLFVAVMQASVQHNLLYLTGVMEPVCARFLRSFGIDFKPISPILDYHGLRQGFIGYLPDILDNVYRVNMQLWSLLTDRDIHAKRPK